MSCGVCVHLESFASVQIVGGLQEARAQFDRVVVRGRQILDPEVHVDLLRRPIGPLRSNVVRRELHADPPLAVEQDTVPIVVRDDRSAEQAGPERVSAARSAASNTMTCRRTFIAAARPR